MTQHDDFVHVGHMVDLARKARQLVGDHDREAYDADEALQYALVHLVQTIGEAARHVSADGRAAHPEIPWHRIVGMRHRIVHDYLNVDTDIVWGGRFGGPGGDDCGIGRRTVRFPARVA